MCGVLLTVYLQSGWPGSKFPALTATGAGGDLWNDLISRRGDAHLCPFQLAGYAFVGGGFWLIAAAWRVLPEAAPARPLGDQRPVRACAPRTVCRVPADHDGFLLQCRPFRWW